MVSQRPLEILAMIIHQVVLCLHMNQFLIISFYKFVYILLVLILWRTLTNTVTILREQVFKELNLK